MSCVISNSYVDSHFKWHVLTKCSLQHTGTSKIECLRHMRKQESGDWSRERGSRGRQGKAVTLYGSHLGYYLKVCLTGQIKSPGATLQ